jgi:ABC-type sugar transport system ATPase subunit
VRVSLPGREPTDPGPGIAATVELVEALGYEQLMHLRIGNVSVAARGTPGERPPIGTPVHVTMDPARLRLFDADSGAALPGATGEALSR